MLRRILTVALATATIGFVSPHVQATPEPTRQEEQCRFKHRGETHRWTYNKAVLTIRCASEVLHPIGGVEKALSVFNCETPALPEPSHSDSYHGPFQYLKSTFHSQQSLMPGIVGRYDLKRGVHNIRSNIITAIGWARWSWSPWTCA